MYLYFNQKKYYIKTIRNKKANQFTISCTVIAISIFNDNISFLSQDKEVFLLSKAIKNYKG